MLTGKWKQSRQSKSQITDGVIESFQLQVKETFLMLHMRWQIS